MTHKETIKAILEQFDSYKSNCVGCRKYYDTDADLVGAPDICERLELICRKKLLEAAEGLDG